MDIKTIEQMSIAIIGGTGNEGKGLAYRWAAAGLDVIIGSRSEEKAQEAIEALKPLLKNQIKNLRAMTNQAAAAAGDIIVLTVPYNVQTEMVKQIASFCTGKILINVSVPLKPPNVTKVFVPEAGSAAQEIQQILGEESSVVAAFQNVSFEHLISGEEINCDVLVCGKGKDARAVVLELIDKAGMNGWDAGPIENAIVVEGLTSILIGINKAYGVKSSGIRISGVPGKSVI